MIFNNHVKVDLGEDPFSQNELAEEPSRLAIHWKTALQVGRGTGETHVMNPFYSPIKPQHLYELEAIPSLMGCGDISNPGHISYPTGTLLHSKVPFLHGRGSTSPGIRVAIDFGLMTDSQLEHK